MATQAAERTADQTLGFRSLDEEVHVDSLPVQGGLPGWLRGDLTRVTPALLDVGGVPLRHWFDGLAMLNAFRIADGHVGYASRFLETKAREGAREGRFDAWGFGQDPCRSLFGRMTAAFSPPENDNANVNLTRLGDRYVAMTEMPVPVEFDRQTLGTVGQVKWRDRVGGAVGSAHPHHDREADELVSYVVDFSARSAYKLFAVTAGSDERRLIAKIPAGREPSYLHSIAMSEHYLVVVAWPAVMDPLRLIAKGGGFMDAMRWKPERGTAFHVVDRHSGEHVATAKGEAFFCFHHINAYEEGDEVVVDLCAYEDSSIIEALEVSKLRAGDTPPPQAFPTRYRVPLDGGEVHGERLSEQSLELPRIDYGRHNARPYRYVYGAGSSDWLDRVVKLDVESRETLTWREEGCYPGEPVFVRRPGGEAEDDGVLLSLVLDAGAGRSFLAVLDAATLEELARAEAPHAIPFGFHGQFFR
jgi:beta,beta-carotene 9',10'-dioxygenase